MSALQAAVHAHVRRPFERESLIVGFGVLVACVVTARLLSEPTSIRLGIVGVAALMIIALGAKSPVALLGGLVVWLTALGLLRRVLNTLTAVPHSDPLLLVAPLAMTVLFLAAARQGAFERRSILASSVLALNALTIIGALNPLQGGLATGVGGLLFVLVPTMAFWVGRGLFDDRAVLTVLKLFAFLGIPAAIYGLAQTFSGFPSWDSAWLAQHKTDYEAIAVHGVPRAFASFSGGSEYATFLAIGLVIWVAFGLTPVLAPVAVAAIGMSAFAIFWEGSRGIIVLGVVALAMMIGARRGFSLKWSLAVSAILLLLVPYTVTRIVGADYSGGNSPLVTRQVQGLQNPTNSEASTLGSHVDLLTEGIRSARSEPVGRGTGAITIAALKFGGVDATTEADPSNAAVAWGVLGLIVYLVILAAGLWRGYRLAFMRRDWLAAVALAIVILTTSQWLNGGQYAVAFLPWLLLGWIDRTLGRASSSARKPA